MYEYKDNVLTFKYCSKRNSYNIKERMQVVNVHVRVCVLESSCKRKLL